MEQDIGFEPMTFSLATKHSTTELILHCICPGFTPGVPHVVITAALHLVIAHRCQHFYLHRIYAARKPLNLSAA